MGELGKLIVRIAADSTQLVSGLNSVQKTVSSFATATNKILGVIGFTLTAKAVFDLGKQAIELGDQLNRLSVQTGMTAGELARLKFAAEQSDTSLESVVGTFRFLSKNMNEAANGSAEAQALFRNFHVEFQNADGTLRSYNDVMLEVADRIKNTDNETLILAEGQKLLGRGFAQTIPFFKQGSEALKAYFKEFEKFGLSDKEMTEFAKSADELKDAWNKLTTVFQYFVVRVMTPLIPKMEEFTEMVANADWAGYAQNIQVLADAFGALSGHVQSAVEWLQKYSPLAAAARFAGTLAGGGTVEDAARAAGDTDLLSREEEMRQAMENPIDLGEVHTGPAGGDNGTGITQGNKMGFLDEMKAKMEELKTSWGNLNKSIVDTWVSTVEGIATGFGNGLARVIVDGEDFGQMFKSLWKDIAKQVIAEITAIIVKLIALQVIQMATGFGGGGGGGGFFKKLFSFRDGGAIAARDGLFSAGGMGYTGPFGEGGINAILHPGEVVTPIDKLFDFMKASSGNKFHIEIQGGQNDPQTIAEKVILEVERKMRRP